LKSKKLRIGAILLAVVIVTVAIAGVSFASSSQSNETAVSDLCQSFISKLAANLGVDQDKVTAALEATKKQMLDEAVQQGKITQEQADKISSSVKGGLCGGFGYLNGKFRGQGNFKGEGFKGHGYGIKGRNLDDIANVLGMTTDELNAEIQSGKNIGQIVTECGMTVEEFHEKMLELKKAEISQAVADGKMTQEQADKILQKLEQRNK